MKSKPKGAKGRNLTMRDGVIYYDRVAHGRRFKISTKTASWEDAASFRDAFEAHEGIGKVPFFPGEVPRFADFAARYLAEATARLAGSTVEDRVKLLRPGGMVARYFERFRVDEITRPILLEWWHLEVETRGRSQSTGMNYLAALSGVLGYAADLDLLPENPVDAFRLALRRRLRGKRSRADTAKGRHVHPLESAHAMAAFVRASEELGGERFKGSLRPVGQHQVGHVADMLQLDAGLRIGEVAGLRWRDVVPGRDAADTTRALLIRESRARGKHDGGPKSGRERRVALSLRLRAVLRDFWVAQGQPGADERVLPRFHPRNYAGRHFDAVCRRASLEGHTPKDLRDSFASWLLTCGVQLGYVSAQLGHADVAVTAAHYAKWAGGDAYRRPLEVQGGEVPADLLARLCEEESHHSHTTALFATDQA